MRTVAQVLAAAAKRPGDLAARYGGEEFAVLLANTGREAAMSIAEGLCDRVLALAIPHDQSDVAARVTVSIGVFSMMAPCADQAEWPFQCPECARRSICLDGPVALVQAADQGLYLAKSDGRNRAVPGV